MSDLQCPAIVILTPLEGVAAGERLLAGRHVAGRFLVATAATAAAARAAAGGGAMEMLGDVVDGAGLRGQVDALADLHRGETVWVVAPSAMIAAALGRGELVESVVVAIDSSGWTVRDQ